jgi:hypothetical protein
MRANQNGSGTGKAEPAAHRSWNRDMLRGLMYALLIIVSILFFSGAASRFIYVDF